MLQQAEIAALKAHLREAESDTNVMFADADKPVNAADQDRLFDNANADRDEQHQQVGKETEDSPKITPRAPDIFHHVLLNHVVRLLSNLLGSADGQQKTDATMSQTLPYVKPRRVPLLSPGREIWAPP